MIPCLPRGEKKKFEQALNYADSTVKEMTDYFQTRVESLEPKEDERKSSTAAKKPKDKKSTKKKK